MILYCKRFYKEPLNRNLHVEGQKILGTFSSKDKIPKDLEFLVPKFGKKEAQELETFRTKP